MIVKTKEGLEICASINNMILMHFDKPDNDNANVIVNNQGHNITLEEYERLKYHFQEPQETSGYLTVSDDDYDPFDQVYKDIRL